MAEGDGQARETGNAFEPYPAEAVTESGPETAPVRPQGTYLWYVPLTLLVIADIIAWRLAFIEPAPVRWISLAVALVLIAPALPVAARCPVDS